MSDSNLAFLVRSLNNEVQAARLESPAFRRGECQACACEA